MFPKKSLHYRAQRKLSCSAQFSLLSRLLSNSPTPCSNSSDTQTDSSMFVLMQAINESDDHVPSFFITASGTAVAANLFTPLFFPQFNAISSRIMFALATFPSLLDLSLTVATTSHKHWAARPLNHSSQPSLSHYDIE